VRHALKYLLILIIGLILLAAVKRKVYYPISAEDQEYLDSVKQDFSEIIDNAENFSMIAYNDENAGKIKLNKDRYLEIQLDVLPIPYIGKYFKGIISIDEYARFYNVWQDSIHIQEEKRGTYIYKFYDDSTFQLLKYYGDRPRRKHREKRLFPGPDLITLINSRFNGQRFNELKTFAFAFPYIGTVEDFGDSISLDPNKFFVIEKKGLVPIMDDKNIPIKDMNIKFDADGNFLRGGGLIKKGFDTHIIIRKTDL
jgi:hypothetical protein